MNKTFIYAGLGSLLVIFCVFTISTITYNIEYVQYSAALGNIEECKKLKVESIVSGDIKDLAGCKLIGANLRNADLSGADLSETDLRGADLTGADMKGANLHGAILYGADLREADLY